MRRGRRAYYDTFSKFYDRFVALHSRDKQGLARRFLTDQISEGASCAVLDLCTGTGSLLAHIHAKLSPNSRAVGLDFSHGMLKVAAGKNRESENVHLVEADAGGLPFPAHIFDAVTCSHAFYELKGETQAQALKEIVRVLKPDGVFLMMEHDVPHNLFIRVLFYVRLTLIGSGRAVAFLRHEQEVLEQHFRTVRKIQAPAGRSKIMRCQK
ncbi:MAG TPA: methyltransferase domain-containing protein [Candidatus Sulfotelmatobacter sp.]|nr:methyltransferase domain-containing protein [Candidatus Sulfotelmatobacter sp.]